MQVFRTALQLVFRSPVYLLLYIVFFGLLGVLIVSSVSGSAQFSSNQADAAVEPPVAVIDRDGSEVSKALTSFINEHATPIELEDTTQALQDATALNLTSYILIIPEGFGQGFIEGAQEGTELPVLQTVTNYAESDAVYLDLLTTEYLNALRISAQGGAGNEISEIVARADAATRQSVSVETVSLEEDTGANALTVFYFQWMAYPITTGLIVLTGMIFAAFKSGELRRRNLCAPLSPSKMNIQVALGCLSLVFLTWAFLIVLALLPFSGGGEVLIQTPATFGLLALAAFVYALVPFGIGFLLSQFGLKDIAINGLANIVSLTFCFLSGVFMGSADMLGEGVQAIARFTPTYWYSDALLCMGELGQGAEGLSTYFSDLGIVALFALIFFVLALIVGRVRARNSDAGGNPAAETTQ